jgi:TolB-like protein/Tfp pilus assembly protein PilF
MNVLTAPLPLGSHTFDVEQGELLGPDGEPATLRRQVLRLLRVLAESPGEVVSKDTLLDRVWPDVVVTEGSLTQAVSELRRVLGDDGHRLLRNVARRGYRLVPDEPPDQFPLLSFVVLPFVVEGAPDGLDWLADALHGDLINELGRSPDRLVIARETSVQYAADTDPRRLARELRVRHVLTLRLRFEGGPEGGGVRLLLQRIDGASGLQASSLALVVARDQLPAGIHDLALQLVHSMQPDLVLEAARSTARLSPAQVNAEVLTMQANALLYRGLNPDHLHQARQLLDRALALDPQRRTALKLSATVTIHALVNGWADDSAAARQRIDEILERLSAQEAGSADELMVRVIQAFLRSDVRAMLRLARGLVERQRHPVHMATHGLAALLCGEAEEATAALLLALRLSPRDPMRAEWLYRLAAARYMLDDDDEAVCYAESAIDINPALNWPPIHVAALWRRGEQAAARRLWAEHLARLPLFKLELLERRLPGEHPVLLAMRRSLQSTLTAVSMAV